MSVIWSSRISIEQDSAGTPTHTAEVATQPMPSDQRWQAGIGVVAVLDAMGGFLLEGGQTSSLVSVVEDQRGTRTMVPHLYQPLSQAFLGQVGPMDRGEAVSLLITDSPLLALNVALKTSYILAQMPEAIFNQQYSHLLPPISQKYLQTYD